MTSAAEARARSRECRLRVLAALEHGPLTRSELRARMPDMQDSHFSGAVRRLQARGLIHTMGDSRNGGEPVYELWSRVVDRMRVRARERRVGTMDDVSVPEARGRAVNARRVA